MFAEAEAMALASAEDGEEADCRQDGEKQSGEPVWNPDGSDPNCITRSVGNVAEVEIGNYESRLSPPREGLIDREGTRNVSPLAPLLT